VQLCWLLGGAFYDALALRKDDLAGLLECFAPEETQTGTGDANADDADAVELEWRACMSALAERTFAVLSQPERYAAVERQVHVSSCIPLLYRAGMYECLPDAPGSLRDMFELVQQLMLAKDNDVSIQYPNTPSSVGGYLM
jgi:hypothetical protein